MKTINNTYCVTFWWMLGSQSAEIKAKNPYDAINKARKADWEKMR